MNCYRQDNFFQFQKMIIVNIKGKNKIRNCKNKTNFAPVVLSTFHFALKSGKKMETWALETSLMIITKIIFTHKQVTMGNGLMMSLFRKRKVSEISKK